MDTKERKESTGYFREKAIIGLSTLSGDELSKAILKTTSHMLKAPKEKYMQRLLAASYGHCKKPYKEGYPVNEYIVRELDKRAYSHNWIVVFKAMVTFHRLLCDGSDEIVERICAHHDVFKLSSIRQITDRDGGMQKFFICQYMNYLEARCTMQSTIGYMRRIETSDCESYFDSLSVRNLSPVFIALLSLLDALTRIQYDEFIVDNYCTLEAHEMIIRDAKRLFELLSKKIIFALNGFTDLPLEDKRIWLAHYERYTAVSDALRKLFDSMITSIRQFAEPIPKLKPVPASLLERLRRDLDLSEAQVEAPVSLASLGISSAKEDKRKDQDEDSLQVSKPASSPSKAVPAPVAPPPPEPPRPAIPTFCMEDLFQPQSPPPTSLQMQPATTVSRPAPSADPWGNGAPTGEWSTGAPSSSPAAPSMWSAGVPTDFSSSAQQQQHQLPQQTLMSAPASSFPRTSNPMVLQENTAPSSYAAAGPLPSRTSKTANDPFKDLFLQSQQWQQQQQQKQQQGQDPKQ